MLLLIGWALQWPAIPNYGTCVYETEHVNTSRRCFKAWTKKKKKKCATIRINIFFGLIHVLRRTLSEWRWGWGIQKNTLHACIHMHTFFWKSKTLVLWNHHGILSTLAMQDVRTNAHDTKRPRMAQFLAPHVLEATKQFKQAPVKPVPFGELLLENYASGKTSASTVSGINVWYGRLIYLLFTLHMNIRDR